MFKSFPSTAAICSVLWALLAASAVSAAELPDRTLSPYFFVKGGDASIDRLPLKGTAVKVDITGVIASVTVRQTYANLGPRPIHAEYVFPGSTRAAVTGLKMVVGDRTIEAALKERGEAKRVFQAAQREGKTATLLEQDRPNVFRMSVANLLPSDVIQVELHYTELLVPNAGVYELVYPTVVGPRYTGSGPVQPEGNDFTATPYLPQGVPPTPSFTLTATLATAIALQEVGSPSHAVKVVASAPDRASVVLEPGQPSAGQKDFLLRYRLAGNAIQTGLLLEEGSDEHFFTLLVQPPKRVTAEQLPPREYVFILDTSGSMRGFPLAIAKNVLKALTAQLRPQDVFNVLLFSGDSELLFPASVRATPENVKQAVHLVDGKSGGGGTELRPALERAMGLSRNEGRSRTFVVVTDGFISTERELFASIREHLGDANVFCIGIGSSVNRYLTEGIAKAGLGEELVITRPEQVDAQVQKFIEYVRAPVLTDLRLEAKGVEIYDLEPAHLPDVLAERPIVIQGKWRGPRTGVLHLTGTSGSGPFHAALTLSDGRTGASPGVLRQLWARARLQSLSDYSSEQAADIKEHATALALRYGLLSRFTSFVAVEEVRRTIELADSVKQPLPLPEGVEDSALGASPEVGAEPSLTVLLALAGAAWMVWKVRWGRA